jgi:exopolyphosphatase
MLKVGEFVRKAKQVYTQAQKASVVIGNQSADLDSIASAISMSYYLTSVSQDMTTYIPFINSSKAIISSKKECLYLFNSLSINFETDLLFMSDWSADKSIGELILVDHNELDDKQVALNFSNLVTGIVDHHLDKGEFSCADPRIVDTSVGSNITLICDLIYKSKIKFDKSFSLLMLMPILSDTNNLKMRASQKDFEMVEFLQEMGEHDCDKIYKQIEELKFSNDSLEDTKTILLKDYKQYAVNGKKWAMSSVTFCIRQWAHDETNSAKKFEDTFSFMRENDLHFFGMLSCFKETNGENFKRDLLLVGNFKELETFAHPKLNFVKSFKDKSCFCALYDVAEVNLTRKFWQPVLENFFKTIITN